MDPSSPPAGTSPPDAPEAQALAPEPSSGRSSSVRFLSDVIVELGYAPRDRVEAAVDQARAPGKNVGRILVESGDITEEQLGRAVAEHHSLEFLDLGSTEIDMGAANLVKPSAAQRYHAVPIRFIDRGTLLVAMADPADSLALSDIAVMTRLEIQPAVASRAELEELISRLPRHGEEATAPPSPMPPVGGAVHGDVTPAIPGADVQPLVDASDEVVEAAWPGLESEGAEDAAEAAQEPQRSRRELERALTEVESLRASSERRAAEIARLQDENERLQNQLEQPGPAEPGAQDGASQDDGRLQAAEARLATAGKQIQAANAVLKDNVRVIEELRSRLEAEQSARQELESLRAELEQAKSAVEPQLERIGPELEEARAEAERKALALAEAEGRAAEAESRLQEAELGSGQQLLEAKRELAKARQEWARERAQQGETAAQLRARADELAVDLQSAREPIAAAEQRAEEAEEKGEEADRRAEQAEREHAEQAERERAEHRQAVAGLQTELDRAREGIERVKGELAESRDQTERLEADLAGSREALGRSAEDVEAAKADAERRAEELRQAEDRIAGAISALAADEARDRPPEEPADGAAPPGADRGPGVASAGD